MSHELDMVLESVAGVIARHTPDPFIERGWNEPLWQALEELGFSLVSVPEDVGGSGGSLQDAAAIARVVGQRAPRVPLPDTMMLGAWLLASSGFPLVEGPAVVAPDAGDLQIHGSNGTWSIEGRLPRVPWGRFATAVAALLEGEEGLLVVRLEPKAHTLELRENLAGEPRDDIIVEERVTEDAVAVAPQGVTRTALRQRGAMTRAISMVGAMEEVLRLTLAYIGQREQFGRPLSRFQAVQQHVAALAGEVMAAASAAQTAVEAVATDGPSATAAVAAAKVRAGMAAGAVAATAHQLHGAIGFTDEYPLHRFTRRLWSWRDEFGNETEWSTVLGREAARSGGDGLYPLITGST